MILFMGVKSCHKSFPGSTRSNSSRWIAQLYQLTFCSVVLMHPFLSPSRYLTWTSVNLNSDGMVASCVWGYIPNHLRGIPSLFDVELL